MLKASRSLCLDICDYEDRKVCNLYDNTADVSGQATDVYVKTERNGWKELSFRIPSTCITEEGEEENYRLQFLIADYKIRLQTENELDWYIISEQKITHDKKSKTVEVTAGHIAQLLKTKALDLEFSDKEGNNTGTAEEILTTILEGTGWHVGNVAQFVEDNDNTIEKIRSFNASSNTGAFRLIEEMCELFDAKPIYYGHGTYIDGNGMEQTGRVIDIVPMNPFSRELQPGEIPEEVYHDLDVIEIHYDKNLKNMTRTVNTDTLVTRLYAYGSYGDENGMCSIQTCTHDEYKLISGNYDANTEFRFVDKDGAGYFFIADEPLYSNTELIYSKLDFMSRSYVWNKTTKRAYRVYKERKGDPEELSTNRVEKKNYFPFLLGFDYYLETGLLSDNLFQKLATYQQTMPEAYVQSEEAAKLMIENEQKLSEILESNTGMAKLAVKSYSQDQEGKLILNLDTNVGDHGVIYRTDYDEAKRNYFIWHVAKELKDNGDPVSGIGSVVYIVHNTNPVTWDIAYVKHIFDDNGNMYVNDIGNPKDYNYGLNDTEPAAITLHMDKGNLALFDTDRFYLFCSMSMSGKLSSKQVADEAVVSSLQNETTVATEKHPTYFADSQEGVPSTTPIQSSYGWYYKFYSRSNQDGELYFCYGARNENSWHRVYFDEVAPYVVNDCYYFNIRSKALYHGVNSVWVQMETAEEQRIAIQFSKVIYYCRQRDMIYKGLNEKYIFKAADRLSKGNYAIKSPYNFFWVTTTDEDIPKDFDVTIDTTKGYMWQNDSLEKVVPTKIVSYEAADFPTNNEIENETLFPGKINSSNGIEENSSSWYRTKNIKIYKETVYEYNLPEGSYIVTYNIDKVFQEAQVTSGSGNIMTHGDAYYARVVVPEQFTENSYFRIRNFDKKLYLSNKEYTIIDYAHGEGELVGIAPLMLKFADLADTTYEQNLRALTSAQEYIKAEDNILTERLGDLLREGYWQEDNFVEGDEVRMYTDAIDNLKEISKPEITYEIGFLDLYGSNLNQGFSIDEAYETDWPDIQITNAVHLVDPDANVNQWAYIDSIEKCYDQPWLTTIEINTKLSLIDQHDFTDVLTRIAEVAKQTKGKQSVYKRAAALSASGKLTTDLLEGNIKANKALILGGASNWWTDTKGNLVFEADDGSGAMMLTGRGILIADQRDSWGDWMYRTGITGQGITADQVVTAFLSAKEALIGAITTDMISASVGQELDIGSNVALMMYATVDGSRPAGGVKTGLHNADGSYAEVGADDSYIQIGSVETVGDKKNPAFINIMTGGLLNIYSGSDMNIKSGADLYIEDQGHFEVKSGGDILLASGGSIEIQASEVGHFVVSSPNFNVDVNGNTDITGCITALTGEIAGLTVSYEKKDNEVVRRFMYAGTDSMASTASGVYIGTDGINFGGGTFKVSKDGNTTYFKTTASSIFLGDIGSNGQLLSGKLSNMDQATQSAHDAADAAQATADTKSRTFRCSAAQIVDQPYKIGDVWVDTGSSYKWQYICNKVSNPRNSSGDWTLVSTAVAEGAALSIDTTNGNIDIVAANNITLAAGVTVKVAANEELTLAVGNYTSGGKTYSGVIKIGHGSKLFEIGCNETDAYIRYNRAGISTRNTNGIYLGTDGINIGKANGNYIMAKADGTIEVTGKITATSGATGGINVSSTVGLYTGTKTSATSTETGFLISKDGAIYLGAYSSTTGSCPFQVTSAGAITATSGKIGGWTIDSTKLYTTKTGMAATSADADIAFWAGNSTASSSNFYVKQSGYLYAKDIHAEGGDVGCWAIDTKKLYAGSGTSYVALDGSTDTYQLSGGSNTYHMYAMWAGNSSPSSAPFSVTKDGIVTIEKLRIKTDNGDYREVSLNDFTYVATSGDAYDWDKLFAKLKFQTVRSVSQNTSTGRVTIRVSNNSGGTSSWSFNTATSVKLGDGSWSGFTSSSYRAYYQATCFYKFGGNDIEVEKKKTAFVTVDFGTETGYVSAGVYGKYESLSNIETARVHLFTCYFEIRSDTTGFTTDHKKVMRIWRKLNVQDDYVKTNHTVTVDASGLYQDAKDNGAKAVYLRGSTYDGYTYDKTLGYGEKWIIKGKYYPAGRSIEANTGAEYTIKAPEVPSISSCTLGSKFTGTVYSCSVSLAGTTKPSYINTASITVTCTKSGNVVTGTASNGNKGTYTLSSVYNCAKGLTRLTKNSSVYHGKVYDSRGNLLGPNYDRYWYYSSANNSLETYYT